MEITINDKSYKIKYTLRAIMLFEQIMDKTFELKGITDQVVFLFCLIRANNDDKLDYEDYLAYLDEHPEMLITLAEVLKIEEKERAIVSSDTEDTDDGTKKK